MSRCAVLGIVVAAIVAVTWVGSATGQVVVRSTGGGGSMGFVGGGDGIYPLLFKLSQDENWSEAKDKLVAKAGEGHAIAVVYTVEKFREGRDEKVRVRLDSVIAALEEAGHYPLQASQIPAQVTRLQTTIAKLAKGTAEGAALNEILMDLDRANKQAERALKIMETGEVPQPPKPSMGGVMRRKG